MRGRRTKTGRPSGGDGANRSLILQAARQQFASLGFHATTMRGVAAQVGVDVALVAHYFGTKDSLFAAAAQFPEGVDDLLVDAISAPLATQGKRLTRAYFGLWEAAETGDQMRVLARAALSNQAGVNQVSGLIAKLIASERVAPLVEGRTTGMALAASHLMGTAVSRYLGRLPALTELSFEELVERVSSVVQTYLESQDRS